MSTEQSHTFTFKVSGVELSDAAKERISADIAAVVAKGVVAENPATPETDMWSLLKTHGGIWIAGEDAKVLTARAAESGHSFTETLED